MTYFYLYIAFSYIFMWGTFKFLKKRNFFDCTADKFFIPFMIVFLTVFVTLTCYYFLVLFSEIG